eukprot:2912777-Amphidinium_carterae.1
MGVNPLLRLVFGITSSVRRQVQDSCAARLLSFLLTSVVDHHCGWAADHESTSWVGSWPLWDCFAARHTLENAVLRVASLQVMVRTRRHPSTMGTRQASKQQLQVALCFDESAPVAFTPLSEELAIPCANLVGDCLVCVLLFALGCRPRGSLAITSVIKSILVSVTVAAKITTCAHKAKRASSAMPLRTLSRSLSTQSLTSQVTLSRTT